MQATEALYGLTAVPVIVATFSTRYLIPSLSHAYAGEDREWGTNAIDELHDTLEEHLRNQVDPMGFVMEQIDALMMAAGVERTWSRVFGGELKLYGKLAVVVASGGETKMAEAATEAELIAACAFGSRPAVFTRDNSLELSALRNSRFPYYDVGTAAPRMSAASPNTGLNELLAFAKAMLRASAVATYEIEDRWSRTSTDLALRAYSPLSEEVLDWLPEHVSVSDSSDVPATPELGGSRFSDVGRLASLCVASRRRLVGVVGTDRYAFCVPYGFDQIRERPIGALCMVWPAADAGPVGVYEIAVARMIALHLAREYDERRATSSVQLVTSQLSYISDLPSAPAISALNACSPELVGRLDVGLVATSVSRILKGLVDLSGAMSVACRLIAGADGPHLSRYLARLHCEGQANAAASPHKIDLDSFEDSANAWVAVHGRPVYLRSLEFDETVGACVSPDLASYPGLKRVQVYRDNVQSELCVPIFAERRIVGTVNLEADRPRIFDATFGTVAEFAQLIGIALLESRRRIGMDTVTEAGGFLDHRHQLEKGLLDLGKELQREDHLSVSARDRYKGAITQLTELIFMRRLHEEEYGDRTPVETVLRAAMAAVKWADTDAPLQELVIGDFASVTSLLSADLGEDAAKALTFAIGQALHNVLKYATGSERLAGRSHLAMFRLQDREIGGSPNVYISVTSVCSKSRFEKLDPQRVFREPIVRNPGDRVSLGAYLAGEAVRRCGGSAYFRVEFPRFNVAVVDAEFSVPLLGAS